MGAVRSFVSQIIRRHFEGRDVFVGQQGMFGHDAIADIQRLAGLWKLPLRTVFDVGANDGDTADEVLKRLPEARVLSFEPHPATFKKLTKRLGAESRFGAFNLALGDRAGESEMVEYGNTKINSLLPEAPYAHRFQEKGRTIKITLSTLDAFCAQHGISTLDVLKIDTEGFELPVLEGSRSMLQAGSIRFVYCEFNELFPRNGNAGGALLPLAELLSSYGYRFVASYNDYIMTTGEMFGVSNALFVLPPTSA